MGVQEFWQQGKVRVALRAPIAAQSQGGARNRPEFAVERYQFGEAFAYNRRRKMQVGRSREERATMPEQQSAQ